MSTCVCLYVCICTTLKQCLQGCWIPWKWNHRQFWDAMWMLGLNLVSLQDQPVFLTVEPFLKPQYWIFKGSRHFITTLKMNLSSHNIYSIPAWRAHFESCFGTFLCFQNNALWVFVSDYKHTQIEIQLQSTPCGAVWVTFLSRTLPLVSSNFYQSLSLRHNHQTFI